jgi:hypothetical protein
MIGRSLASFGVNLTRDSPLCSYQRKEKASRAWTCVRGATSCPGTESGWALPSRLESLGEGGGGVRKGIKGKCISSIRGSDSSHSRALNAETGWNFRGASGRYMGPARDVRASFEEDIWKERSCSKGRSILALPPNAAIDKSWLLWREISTVATRRRCNDGM